MNACANQVSKDSEEVVNAGLIQPLVVILKSGNTEILSGCHAVLLNFTSKNFKMKTSITRNEEIKNSLSYFFFPAGLDSVSEIISAGKFDNLSGRQGRDLP